MRIWIVLKSLVLVHVLNQILVVSLNDISLQLESSSKLSLTNRQIMFKNHPLTNVLSTRYSNGAVVLLNHRFNVSLPLGAVHHLQSSSSSGAKGLGLLQRHSIQLVRRLTIERIHFGLEGDQTAQELSLITHHNDVGKAGSNLEDLVFNENGRNVLTTSSDDEFLQSTSDVEESILIHSSHITSVEPALAIDGLKSVLLVLEVTHHDVTTLVLDLVGDRVDSAESTGLGNTARTNLPELLGAVGEDGSRTLRLTQNIVKRNIQASEEELGLFGDRGGSNDTETGTREAEVHANLVEEEGLGEAVEERLGVLVVVLSSQAALHTLGTSPIDDATLEALRMREGERKHTEA